MSDKTPTCHAGNSCACLTIFVIVFLLTYGCQLASDIKAIRTHIETTVEKSP